MNRIYEYRRHLPHFQSDYKAIFVTFSTHHRWILPPEARTITLQACLWGNGKLFTLHGVVIMPDHTHLALTPLYDGSGFYSIAEIMQDIKSVSAHRINRALNRVGQICRLDRSTKCCAAEGGSRQKGRKFAKIQYGLAW